VDVTAIYLATPTIADLDLAVSGGGTVPDYEMIGQPVYHPANIPVVIIKDPRISLSGPAVVNDNELPPTAEDGSAIDLIAHRSGKISVSLAKDVKRQRKAGRFFEA
jgi:hypothetical protein